MKTPVERPILIVCGDEETYPIIWKSLNSLKSAKRRYPELSYFLNRHDQMRFGNVEAAKKALNPKAADLVIPVVVILDALVLHSDTPEASETDAAVSFINWLDTWHPNIPVLVVAAHSTEEVERRVLHAATHHSGGSTSRPIRTYSRKRSLASHRRIPSAHR